MSLMGAMTLDTERVGDAEGTEQSPTTLPAHPALKPVTLYH